MNDFYYTTESAQGKDSTLPTPIDLELIQEGEKTRLSVTGTDGQQVTDAVTAVLKQLPCNKDRGIRNFFLGLLFCTAFVTVVAYYTLPRATDPAPTPIQGGLTQ